jgi:hypothetical protein
MKKILGVVGFALALLVSISGVAWGAGAVVEDSTELEAIDLCTNDAYASERIAQEILPENKLDVVNDDDQVVGAVDWDPKTGEAAALYLCGANSGYYYMEGNLLKGEVDSLHNDEYDSVFNVEVEGSDLVISIQAMYFIGSPDSADYPPFAGVIAVRLPQAPMP